jgi:hypothetical protein
MTRRISGSRIILQGRERGRFSFSRFFNLINATTVESYAMSLLLLIELRVFSTH